MLVFGLVVSSFAALALLALVGRRMGSRRRARQLAILEDLVGQRQIFGWSLRIVIRAEPVVTARATLAWIDPESDLIHLDDLEMLEGHENVFARRVGDAETLSLRQVRFVIDDESGAQIRL